VDSRLTVMSELSLTAGRFIATPLLLPLLLLLLLLLLFLLSTSPTALKGAHG